MDPLYPQPSKVKADEGWEGENIHKSIIFHIEGQGKGHGWKSPHSISSGLAKCQCIDLVLNHCLRSYSSSTSMTSKFLFLLKAN